MNLKQYLKKARLEHWAVGHFNFSTADQLRAFVEAATLAKAPIMVATSEGEAEFFGMEQAASLVKVYQKLGYAVWLSADHYHSFEKCKQAIDAGYDSILIDASKLSYEGNIALTKQVVDYAHSVNPDISVEGELGYLRGSSEVQQKIEISPDDYTKPEQAVDFVAKTGVDRLATVFGNIHGIVTKVINIEATPTHGVVGVPTVTSGEEKLDIEHFKKIVAVLPANLTLVLHGASGLKTEDVQLAIAVGISNVHINTELRVAYHDALVEELKEDPTQTTPYKMLKPSDDATKIMITTKLQLFGSVDRL